MYGNDPFGSVPYAAWGGGIIVAACIHVDSQILYSCSLGISQVYFANATHRLLNSVTMTITSANCTTTSEVC